MPVAPIRHIIRTLLRYDAPPHLMLVERRMSGDHADRTGIRDQIACALLCLAAIACGQAVGEDAAGDLPEAQLDGTSFEPETLTYDTRMEAGGQSLDMSSIVARTRATHDGEDVWQVTTTVDSLMGKAVDTVMLRVGDLRPMRRTLEQGPARITLDYTDAAITGEMSMSGPGQPIDVTLDGPAAGHIESAVAGMPLAIGFETELRSFQPATASVQLVHISVAAQETVQTPAGTFDAWRVGFRGDDGTSGSVWVTRAKPHRTVKHDLTQPAMGVRITSELTAIE